MGIVHLHERDGRGKTGQERLAFGVADLKRVISGQVALKNGGHGAG